MGMANRASMIRMTWPWLDTFLAEKGVELDETIEVEGPSGTNWMPVGVLVEFMKSAPAREQAQIKDTLVMIDFKNGDVRHFLKHLAAAVAR